MPRKPSASRPLNVGIPIYAGRVLPRFGVAREFLVASIERGTAKLVTIQTCRWREPSPEGIGAWLRSLGVEWVVCGGIHPRFLVALEAEGLRVVWGQRGPADEVLRQWARGELSVPKSPACPQRGRGCSSPGGTPPEGGRA
ncbi:MAG: NifB/NifX family molybdenum-iron cluster-binding protein [Deltaproteobacteria bacterium]|nr:NifB/NifX family molybdenum-iron cluster-binding protein [Deltaproteobacteria bacterium]